jgi:hypothetical protein
MHNREFLCVVCGRLRRSLKLYPRGRGGKHYPLRRGTAVSPPTCCGQATIMLSLIEGEAASKLRPVDRLAWLEMGMPVLRRGGKRRWVAAMKPAQQQTAKEQTDRFKRAEAAKVTHIARPKKSRG